MNTKNKKLAIPAILVATVMVAGMFAFMPVEQASTVHSTFILPGTIGLACATDTVTLTAGIDGDAITLTFTPAIQLLGLRVITNDATATLGFDADPTVNGAIVSSFNVFEGIDIDEGVEIISDMSSRTVFTIAAGGALVLTVDDDDGNALGAADVITFQACGLVTDPDNFGPASFLITGPNLAE